MWFYILFSLLTIIIAIVTSGYGIHIMVGAYVALCLLSIGGWQSMAGRLIGLKRLDVVKDLAPYAVLAFGCFTVAWFITRPIENLFLLCITKILIVTSLYLSIAWYSGSVILKESVDFLIKLLNNIYAKR